MLGVAVRPLASGPEHGFVPDPAQAEALCDARVRAIVLVTPNNPTGATYPAATIAAFHALCRRRGLWLILDETYRDFRPAIMDSPHELARDGWPDDVVGLYSFSKAYAVPGHRLGAITAPSALAASILKVQDCVQICSGRPIQAAVTWGLTGLASWREERRQAVARAGETFRAAMGSATGWSIASLGAYFAYLRHPHPDVAADGVAERLARERGVLMLPGSDFGPGQERYLRLSFPGLTPEQASQLPQRLTLP
jgi:aspartate/methionine/tyrosine aminotransferase